MGISNQITSMPIPVNAQNQAITPTLLFSHIRDPILCIIILLVVLPNFLVFHLQNRPSSLVHFDQTNLQIS